MTNDKILKAKGLPLTVEQLFKLTQVSRADLESAIADGSPTLKKFLKAQRR